MTKRRKSKMRPKKAVRRRVARPPLRFQIGALADAVERLRQTMEGLVAGQNILADYLGPYGKVDLLEIVRLARVVEAEIKDRGPWSEHIAAAALKLAAGLVSRKPARARGK